jgi:hypothetical protein
MVEVELRELLVLLALGLIETKTFSNPARISRSLFPADRLQLPVVPIDWNLVAIPTRGLDATNSHIPLSSRRRLRRFFGCRSRCAFRHRLLSFSVKCGEICPVAVWGLPSGTRRRGHPEKPSAGPRNTRLRKRVRCGESSPTELFPARVPLAHHLELQGNSSWHSKWGSDWPGRLQFGRSVLQFCWCGGREFYLIISYKYLENLLGNFEMRRYS